MLPCVSATEPWEHQKQAYEFAFDKKAVGLFMDMGTGKSKVAVDLVVNKGWMVTVVLCPKSVLGVWPSEFEEHAGKDVLVVVPQGSLKQKADEIQRLIFGVQPIVIVLNYESVVPRYKETEGIYKQSNPLSDLIMKACNKGGIDAFILDESHRIKSAGSSISKYCHLVGRRVSEKLCLTGTPMPDKPTDIYGQYRFLDESIFGNNHNDFMNHYAQRGFGNEILGYQNENELAERMYKIAFRVKAEDVQDLPATQDMNRITWLNPKSQKIYDELESDLISYIEDLDVNDNFVAGTMEAANVLVKILRLHQITSGIVTIDHENGTREVREIGREKRELFQDLLEDFPQKEPIVVFYKFKHDLNNIIEVCLKQKRRVAQVNGQRNQLETWKQGEQDVIAVQIRSGGAGINLTRSPYGIYYTVTHSLGDYEQSRKRQHRPGQKGECVKYYHLVVDNTIDKDIRDVLENKGSVVKSVIEAVKRGTYRKNH